MFGKVLAQSAASLLLHGCIIGIVLVFSSNDVRPDEQVYHVTLAEFSPVTRPAAVLPPSLPQIEPAKPEPVLEAPKMKPAVEKQPEPKAKKISTKKVSEKAKPTKEKRTTPPKPVQASSSQTTAPAGPSRTIGGFAAYDVDAVDQRPSIARSAMPEYPQKAQRMNKEGKVLVRVVVDTSGHPRECKIHKAEPVGFFEESALEAARKTRFVPGKVGGRPVNTVVVIPFVFALR